MYWDRTFEDFLIMVKYKYENQHKSVKVVVLIDLKCFWELLWCFRHKDRIILIKMVHLNVGSDAFASPNVQICERSSVPVVRFSVRFATALYVLSFPGSCRCGPLGQWGSDQTNRLKSSKLVNTEKKAGLLVTLPWKPKRSGRGVRRAGRFRAGTCRYRR